MSGVNGTSVFIFVYTYNNVIQICIYFKKYRTKKYEQTKKNNKIKGENGGKREKMKNAFLYNLYSKKFKKNTAARQRMSLGGGPPC